MDSKEENRNLYLKVQNVIKYAKIDKYVRDQETIKAEGITFLGFFTGKNNLQIERLKNVKLKIEFLQSQKIKSKDDCTSEELMADIYACAISELGGKFSEEMDSIYKKIKESADVKSDEDIYRLACEKINNGQSYLPIIHQEKVKGIFGDLKAQIDFLKLENNKLENQIILERGKAQLETFSTKDNISNIIIPISVKMEKNA